MISSSEVGGCCRVQVARLFSPWSPFPPFPPPRRPPSSPLLSRFLLPPFRASPLAQGCFHPLAYSLYHSLQPSSCFLGHSTSKNSNPTTITEATHARRSLQGCSPFHPQVTPRNVSIIYGAVKHERFSESFYFGRNLIDD